MVSKLNIYNVNLKHFGRIRYPLNQYILNLKFNQGLNSCELVRKCLSSNTKNNINLKQNSFKFVMILYFNIYTVHLKCLPSVSVKWNFNQGLNSDKLLWKMSKHQKQQYLFLISSKFVMVSKFNIYTVYLKCFDSIRYHLNQYKTLTKNFNQGLNSGELVWKMAKSKHQKQHELKTRYVPRNMGMPPACKVYMPYIFHAYTIN